MIEKRQLEPAGRPKGTVLLGHAMFNSMEYLFSPSGASLADFLVAHGYRVIAFNLTGYGKSQAARPDTDFDRYVQNYKEMIEVMPTDCPLHYIGHSVGGVAGLSGIAAAAKPFYTVTLICPAVWGHAKNARGVSLAQKAQLRAASLLVRILGRLPAAFLGLGNTDAPSGYINQLQKWAAAGVMTALDGSSYTSKWRQVPGKLLVLEAAYDPWMATPANVCWILEHLPRRAKRLRIDTYFSKHFSILYGREAKAHVWPLLIKNLENQA